MSTSQADKLEWRGNIAEKLMNNEEGTAMIGLQMAGYYTDHTIMSTSGYRFMGSFGFFWTSSKDEDKEGAYYISTGHYIQSIEKDNKIFISSGTDPDKDQSFFMWGLPTEIMKRMLLPLGNKTKAEVREYAEKKGFKRVSVKKDSLGVCFCPGDYRDFLRDKEECKNINEGNFVDINGKYMGKHKGYPFYTVGQRRALGINLQQAHFVKEILPEKNIIILTNAKDMNKTSSKIKVIVFNYPWKTSKVFNCILRSQIQHLPCSVTLLDNIPTEIILLEP